MLPLNSIAPDFTLPDHDGRSTSLQDLLDDGPLILYFYPADFTAVCTEEACMFRDAVAELAAAGIRVVGVSPDSPERHTRFRREQGLQFPLLSDPDRAVAKAYKSIGLFGILPFGIRRVTYLIGVDRRILDAVAADFRVARHRAFVEHAIEVMHNAK